MDEKIFNEDTDILEPEQQIFDDDDKIEVKPIERENVDEGYSLSSGEALNESELYALAARKQIHFVYILGSAGSGKTTLETMLYGTFVKSIDEEILFAGSETLIGFEKRFWNIRAETGRSTIEMERTIKGERRVFLHLNLYDRIKAQHCNLILSDISGETFEECCSNCENLERELKYLDIAKNIVLFIDGEKLLDKSERHGCVSKIKYFLQTLSSSQYYDPSMNVDIVISKNDIIYDSTEQNAKEFINAVEQKFYSYIGKFQLHFFRIESINGANLNDSQTSIGLTELMKYWMNTTRKTEDALTYSEKQKVKNECNRFGERY